MWKVMKTPAWEAKANETWALYKSNPPRVSWGSPSSDLCVTYANLASPTGNIFARGLLIVQNRFVFVAFSSKIKV